MLVYSARDLVLLYSRRERTSTVAFGSCRAVNLTQDWRITTLKSQFVPDSSKLDFQVVDSLIVCHSTVHGTVEKHGTWESQDAVGLDVFVHVEGTLRCLQISTSLSAASRPHTRRVLLGCIGKSGQRYSTVLSGTHRQPRTSISDLLISRLPRWTCKRPCAFTCLRKTKQPFVRCVGAATRRSALTAFMYLSMHGLSL